MSIELRWLPIVKDDGNDDVYGPAVRNSQDAKDWCQNFDTENEPSPLDWGQEGTGVWGANGEYYDFEIVPMEVEV